MNQDLANNPIKERLQYIGTDLSNLYHLVRQSASKATVYHYPCSQVYVPRLQKISEQLARPNPIPKDAFVLPPRHVSDVLIEDYFESVAPGLPIIDETAFMAAYNDPNGEPPFLLLQVICLVGAHVNKNFGNTNTLKATFFRRAKALLDGRYEDDRMNTVQAAILLTWMSDGADDVNANSWYWVGKATRAAIGLGMHRDVIPSNMPVTDKRLWRRIWWVLMQFDCLVSLIHGRPQTM
jgi:transcriptional regulatory protein AMDR